MLLKTLVDVYVRLWRVCDADGSCQLTWAELAGHTPGCPDDLEDCLSALADFGVVEGLRCDAEGASFRLIPLHGLWPQMGRLN